MSNNTNEEDAVTSTAGETSPPKARKTAAKKTAAKKAAVKKTAARKTAKKAASPVETPELPFLDSPSAADQPAQDAAPAAKKARARKTTPTARKSAAATDPSPAAEPAPAAAREPSFESPAPADSSDAGRRFGRVPGGGPTATRDSPEPPASPPAPATADEPAPRPEARRERSPEHPESQGQQAESRSKRRREKRKRRREQAKAEFRPNDGREPRETREPREPREPRHHRETREHREPREPRTHGGHRNAPPDQDRDRRPFILQGPKVAISGMLELATKGFGFIRLPGKNFEQARDDVFVTPEIIRRHNLRVGQWIHGSYQESQRGPQLVEVETVNDMTPEEAAKLPHFDELKAINPTRRISFETTPDRYTTRVIDIMAPVGRGQRGLIVSPPRSGKTTLLLHMAEAIREKYDEAIHLMVVLVDERPEEVTEFRRTLPGAEIYASSNDEQARNHTRIAELAIERAKRLVEAGKDVFLLMDSITRLARAYNSGMNNRGRGTGSGGITIGALEVPRRLFAAARNTRGGGSLTILATALIQTNSRADEAIFMEFKGTGNMELVLDRKIAENYIYPAVDIFKSGTRREELLLPEHMLHKIHLIRRGLSGHRPAEAMERLLFFLKKFPNNPQMLLEIKG
jgi:transcription termination factor Rho